MYGRFNTRGISCACAYGAFRPWLLVCCLLVGLFLRSVALCTDLGYNYTIIYWEWNGGPVVSCAGTNELEALGRMLGGGPYGTVYGSGFANGYHCINENWPDGPSNLHLDSVPGRVVENLNNVRKEHCWFFNNEFSKLQDFVAVPVHHCAQCLGSSIGMATAQYKKAIARNTIYPPWMFNRSDYVQLLRIYAGSENEFAGADYRIDFPPGQDETTGAFKVGDGGYSVYWEPNGNQPPILPASTNSAPDLTGLLQGIEDFFGPRLLNMANKLDLGNTKLESISSYAHNAVGELIEVNSGLGYLQMAIEDGVAGVNTSLDNVNDSVSREGSGIRGAVNNLGGEISAMNADLRASLNSGFGSQLTESGALRSEVSGFRADFNVFKGQFTQYKAQDYSAQTAIKNYNMNMDNTLNNIANEMYAGRNARDNNEMSLSEIAANSSQIAADVRSLYNQYMAPLGAPEFEDWQGENDEFFEPDTGPLIVAEEAENDIFRDMFDSLVDRARGFGQDVGSLVLAGVGQWSGLSSESCSISVSAELPLFGQVVWVIDLESYDYWISLLRACEVVSLWAALLWSLLKLWNKAVGG